MPRTLYDVARQVCHEQGIAWTDPRTGITYEPPTKGALVKPILICSRVGHFADDVRSHCAECGRSVVHRPHVPPDVVKMCAACAAVAIATSTTEPEIRVTDETRREMELYQAKTKGRH